MKKTFQLILILIMTSCSDEPSKNVEKDLRKTPSDSTQSITSLDNDVSDSGKVYLNKIRSKIGEYSSFLFTCSIETTEGVIEGYRSVSTNYFELDSINNSEYLKTALNALSENKDTLICYNHRIAYKYYECSNDNKIGKGEQPLYQLMNGVAIPINTIKSITIKDIIVESDMTGIGTALNISDTAWIKDKPLRCVVVSGYLCWHAIFIYRESELITKTISKIEKIEKEYLKEEEQKRNSVDYNMMEDNNSNGDKVDRIINQELRKLAGEKIIIVNTCTC